MIRHKAATERLVRRFAASPGSVVTFDALIHALYGAARPPGALLALYTMVARLRAIYPGEIVTHYGLGYEMRAGGALACKPMPPIDAAMWAGPR